MSVVDQPETEQPGRRLKVHRIESDPEFPWRAKIVDRTAVPSDVPVGAFATQAEAIRTGCTALTFLAAGIPWRVQP